MNLKQIDWQSDNRLDPENFIWIECIEDFNLPYAYHDKNNPFKHHRTFEVIPFQKNDIFGLINGKFMDGREVKNIVWCYFENNMYPLMLDDKFFQANLTIIFNDVTKPHIRDLKINRILNV